MVAFFALRVTRPKATVATTPQLMLASAIIPPQTPEHPIHPRRGQAEIIPPDSQPSELQSCLSCVRLRGETKQTRNGASVEGFLGGVSRRGIHTVVVFLRLPNARAG